MADDLRYGPAFTHAILTTRPYQLPATVPPYITKERIIYFENLLEEYGRLPYLLVRLAQILGPYPAQGSALALFEEAQAEMAALDQDDDALNTWIETERARLEDEAQQQLTNSNDGRVIYSQVWKPTRDRPLPSLAELPPPLHVDVKDRWQEHYPPGSDLRRKYITSLAIETNYVEDTFRLTMESTYDLITKGVDAGRVNTQTGSKVKEPEVIRAIIIDTISAFNVMQCAVTDPSTLTPSLIHKVHHRLLNVARFTEVNYASPGDTRTVTRKTVIIGTPDGSSGVQVCPYNLVDDEMDELCEIIQEYLQRPRYRNPFAAASWLHLALVRCHPYNDGNGRATRMISSIPLLNAGYPPINIPFSTRAVYYRAINESAEDKHILMMGCLLDGMRLSMDTVEAK